MAPKKKPSLADLASGQVGKHLKVPTGGLGLKPKLEQAIDTLTDDVPLPPKPNNRKNPRRSGRTLSKKNMGRGFSLSTDPKRPGGINPATLLSNVDSIKTVLELRLSGMSYENIAKEVNLTREKVWHIVDDAMEQARKSMYADADKIRTMEMQRLDELQMGVWEKAKSGDARAADIVLRVMKRRAELSGIDSPVRTEVMGGIALVDWRAEVAKMGESMDDATADALLKLSVYTAKSATEKEK